MSDSAKRLGNPSGVIVVVVALMILAGPSVSAQDQDRRSLVPDVMKQVILDPTTYAPSIVAWKAMRLDWQSSQIFFQNGFVEQNSRYTVSGFDHDTAISYAAGNRQILTDAFSNLRLSLLNNASERVLERVLMTRYPGHRKLLRTMGWLQRGGVAAYRSYLLSSSHFRQWRENERLSRQLGL